MTRPILLSCLLAATLLLGACKHRNQHRNCKCVAPVPVAQPTGAWSYAK